jgi:hypothetical protein
MFAFKPNLMTKFQVYRMIREELQGEISYLAALRLNFLLRDGKLA